MAEIDYGTSNTDPSQGPVINLPSFGVEAPAPTKITITPKDKQPDDWQPVSAAKVTPAEASSAILGQESNNTPNAPTSVDGAVGQAQIEPDTFKQYAKPGEDINNPNDNLAVHNRIIDDLHDKTDGDPARIAVGYFSGPGNIAPADSPTPWKKDVSDGNGKTVSSYVSDVLGRLNPIGAAQASQPKVPATAQEQPDDWQPVTPEKEGVGGTIRDQALQGATFGFGDEAQAGLAALVESGINGKNVAENYEAAHKIAQEKLNQESNDNPATSLIANLAGGIGTGVVGAGTKVGAAAGNLLRGGLLPKAAGTAAKVANTASKVALASGAGATSGALYGAGTANEDQRLEGAEGGGELGAILGGAIPAVSGTAGALKSAIALPAVNEALRPLAQKAIAMGIPLSRSQIGNSPTARLLSSTTGSIPFSGAPDFYRKQQTAFNRAIAKTFGQDADAITPEVINKAYSDIGAKYDAALKGKKIRLSHASAKSLAEIEDELPNLDPSHRDIVQNQINKIYDEYAKTGGITGGGYIKGETLGAIRSSVSKGASIAPPGANILLGKLRDVIMDMSGEAAPLLKEANSQYRVLKTIKGVAAKAQADGGDISPSLLRGAVISKYDLSRGEGGALGDLANIGQAFLKDKVPDSGTAKRLMAYMGITGGLGEIAAFLHAPVTAGLSIAAPIAGSKGFQLMNNSQKSVARVLNDRTKKIGYSALKKNLAAGNVAGQIGGYLNQ